MDIRCESITAAGSLSPLQLSSTHGYDNNGNETSKSENWGAVSNSIISTYDGRNNLKTFSQTGLGTTKYNYDNNDNVTAIDDASGRSTTFAYNDRNLISGLTSGAGAGAGTSQFDYDGNGNLTQITDARGKATVMAYDGYDRVKSVLDPLGNETLISRANFGNLLTIKRLNSLGTLLRQSATLNDPLGRMASRSDKLLETSEDVAYVYGYANLPDGGQEITITDPLGRVSKVSKDKEGKVFKEEDAAGNEVEYYYEDGRGNMTRKVEKEKSADSTFTSYETRYVYNAFNKVEKLTENVGTPQEALTTFFYDERGNLSGSIDAEGHKLYHEYDQFGRKTKTTRELDSGEKLITQFAYDADNNLVSITDANGNQTRYEYDTVTKRNWLTKVVYPDSSTIEYTYDLNGNVLTEKQRNGTVVTNTYNDLNLLTHRAIQPAAGVLDTTGETYEYDGASRLTKATDNDSTVVFGYDSLNRRTSENQNGKLIQYTYDKVNNLTSIQYPNQRIIEREFDLLNRINKIKQGGTDIANMEFIGRTYRMLSKGYQNGDVIKYLYDQGRRMTGIDAKNLNQQIINQYAYGYNKVNLKNYEQRLHDANKGDVYAYDALNRIKNIKFDAPDPTDPLTAQFAKAKTYNLDKVDNILKIVENKNNVDAEILTEMTGTNAQLNQYSKFDQWNLAYDANGNTIQKGTQQFAYNYRNQLVRGTNGANTFNYQYDVFNRLIEKNGNGATTRYYYAGNQKIEERDGSDNVKSQYVYGNGIDELLRMDKYSGNTPTPYYFHTNGIGSTTVITDSTGALVERFSYDTFGLPSFTDASGQPIASSLIGNTTLFQGREYDQELNLYNYRARYYDPIMGRFLQTDPVGYQDSMNLYQGMNMNPGNFVDPMGEWVQGVHKDITMNAARLAALSIQNIFEFISKRQAEFFSSGLKAGSVWPDMPEGPIGALQNAFDIIQIQPLIIGGQVYIMPNFGLVEESNPNTSSLTWQSHFGPLQYWHAMSYGNRPREETRRLIINDVSNWLKQARELLYGDAGKLSSAERYNAAGQMAGRALHVIEDSYTKSHTKRDKYTFAIIEFFDYSKQNKAEHEKMDVLNNETRLNYKKAEEIALKVLILLLQKDNKQFDAELAGMLETIFKLNN